jgi:ATP-binding cassette subfamily B protein
MILSASASNRFGAALRCGLYRRIQTFSFADIESFHTGSLITRLTNDTTLLQQLSQSMLRIFIRAPLMLAGSIFMALQINRSLISVLILLIPVLAVIIASVFKRAFPLFLLTQKRLDRLNTVLQENLAGVRVVKAFSGELREEARFREANAALCDVSLRSGRIVVLLIPLLMLAMHLGVVAVVAFGAAGVRAGRITVGDIMAYISYLANILQALMTLSFVLMAFSRAEASFSRVAEVLEAGGSGSDVVRTADSGHRTPPNAAPQSVTFENVFFSYGGKKQEESMVLSAVSFHLEPGKTLGIIGSIGSGKSTLLSLIPRLCEATLGRVLVGGRDVRTIPPGELRGRVGFVMQENLLFSETIAENIRWGKPDATDAEVRRAAELAAAGEFIRALPGGYATRVGQRGVNLSGGQKQRLCIARALIGNPGVLLLDDCVSSVDFRTESLIRRNISRLEATKIVVAQRVSSVMRADMILVLERGRVAERGTHGTLWKNDGIYRAICDSQPGAVPEETS